MRMAYKILLVALLSIASSAPAQVKTNSLPKRLMRAESFVGIHYDFHAGIDCTNVGQNTTRAMIENIINQVQPDYIQIDCKGHPGFSSYPTKVGNPAPGFVGDPLTLWRQVTAEHGVGLYMHYSGVWDAEAIRKHPEWGAIQDDGVTNKQATSVFGPYVDQLMIPQLRELAEVYRVDGAWVDGDCWAAIADYSPRALAAFRARTGFDTVPRRPGEPHWFEFLQFQRDAFRDYEWHYVTEVKKADPAMQLCCNWSFTDHMPEPVSAPVDWISGDLAAENSVNAARFSARYLAHQGKPWDLMPWAFSYEPRKDGSRNKSVVQLEREAAIVLSQGGGCQVYFTQTRDGSIREEGVPVMAEVARFCRARQRFCHHAEPVPQIAFLYSTVSHYREMNGLFNRELSRLSGSLHALIENRQVVDVVSEHHLAGDKMAAYPLIIVGECDYLEPSFKKSLLDYVSAGGNVLLLGPTTAALFASELGGHSLDNPRRTPLPGMPRQAGSDNG